MSAIKKPNRPHLDTETLKLQAKILWEHVHTPGSRQHQDYSLDTFNPNQPDLFSH